MCNTQLYFAVTSPVNPYIWFMLIDSWLPARKQLEHTPIKVQLVLTPTHEKVIWEQQLESEQREYALDTKRASIHKVAVEQIRIRLRWKPVLVKDVHKIVELAVNVATNGKLAIIGYLDID